MNIVDVHKGRGIFLIEGALSLSECKAQIDHAEAHGFDVAPITTAQGPKMALSIRNNTRVMLDEPERATWLFERLRARLPEQHFGWGLKGLNERLRWYRYGRGERFNWHYDGSYARSPAERSRLTLMVYLSEDFSGGETSFDLPDGHRTVKPTTGTVIVFPHNIRHTGAVVTEGRKYVLRTDVMYARRDP
ncbi:MAG: prolyl 4-hydroxylase [Myxococcota bacterium]|jgi:prolyl 4-hydroxylase